MVYNRPVYVRISFLINRILELNVDRWRSSGFPHNPQNWMVAYVMDTCVCSVESRYHAPDNIAEAAHQRAGSGSCGHPRRSRQRTGGESANWLCSGPAPAEPSLPPPCQHRAGSGPPPAPDSAGASRIAAGLCPPLNARVLLLLHGNTCILHVQLLPTLSKAWAFKAEIKAFKSRKNVHFYVCVCVIVLFLLHTLYKP